MSTKTKTIKGSEMTKNITRKGAPKAPATQSAAKVSSKIAPNVRIAQTSTGQAGVQKALARLDARLTQLAKAPRVINSPRRTLAIARPMSHEGGHIPASTGSGQAAARDVASSLEKFTNHGQHLVDEKGRVHDEPDREGKHVRHGSMYVEPQDDGSCVVSGCELIAALGPVVAGAGAMIATTKFSPLSYGERLAAIAGTFSRWTADTLNMEFDAAQAPVGTPANGLLEMAVNTDPIAPLPSGGTAGVQTAVEYGWNDDEFGVWEDSMLKAHLADSTQNELYVQQQSDPRLYFQVQGFIMAGAPINTGTASLGNWRVWYRIRFIEPVSINELVSLQLDTYSSVGLLSTTVNQQIGFDPNGTLIPITQQTGVLPMFGETAFPGVNSLTGGQCYIGDINSFAIKSDSSGIVIPPGIWSVELSELIFCTATTNPTQVSLTAPFQTTYTASNPGTIPASATVTDTQFPAVNGVLGSLYNSTNGTGTAGTSSYWGTSDSNVSQQFLGLPNAGIGLYLGHYVASSILQAPTQTTLRFFLPRAVITGGANVGVYSFPKLTIRRIGLYGTVLSGGPPGPAALNPRFASKMAIEDCMEALARDECLAVTSRDLSVVASILRGEEPDKNSTMIWPIVAAAVAWFVTEYGAKLSKAALDWGIKKIEDRLEKKK